MYRTRNKTIYSSVDDMDELPTYTIVVKLS